jgi:hypothetical protein
MTTTVEIAPSTEQAETVQQPGLPPEDLVGLPIEALRQELIQQTRKTAEGFLRLAWIVRLLEERGDDLSGLRFSLIPHLRRIAYGQLLPELLVRFGSHPSLLRRVSLLPIPDQKRLVERQSVELAVLVIDPENGEVPVYTKREADPGKLLGPQIFQVFGPDRLRSYAEQCLFLDDARTRTPPTSPVLNTGRVRADLDRGGLILGRTFVPQAEVLEALGRLRPETAAATATAATPAESEERMQVPVPMSQAEHKALKRRALDNGVPMTELIRRAMRVAGLI